MGKEEGSLGRGGTAASMMSDISLLVRVSLAGMTYICKTKPGLKGRLRELKLQENGSSRSPGYR